MMASRYIEAEDARTRRLSPPEVDFFRNYPLHPCFGSSAAKESSLVSIHDFVVALSQLSIQLNDLVLDFGCGAGWVTEWLARMGVRAVGIDVSHGTLRIGLERCRERGVRRAWFARGDMQRAPFRDGAFNSVVCLSSLHHVEDTRAALAEVARILAPDGEAVFIEPGEGHSHAPASVVAMQTHGVLEREILPDEMFRLASEAGFSEFYVVPQFFPTARWQKGEWDEHVAAVGGGEGFGRRLARLWHIAKACARGRGLWRTEAAAALSPHARLQHQINSWLRIHGCYLLRKSLGPRSPSSLCAEALAGEIRRIEARWDPSQGMLTGWVEIVNTGIARWLAKTYEAVGQVRLGLQRLEPDSGRVLERDFARIDLPHDVDPGQAIRVSLDCSLPATNERSLLKLDLVSEGVKWFDAVGPDGQTAVILPWKT